jgi:hypothetical protein
MTRMSTARQKKEQGEAKARMAACGAWGPDYLADELIQQLRFLRSLKTKEIEIKAKGKQRSRRLYLTCYSKISAMQYLLLKAVISHQSRGQCERVEGEACQRNDASPEPVGQQIDQPAGESGNRYGADAELRSPSRNLMHEQREDAVERAEESDLDDAAVHDWYEAA